MADRTSDERLIAAVARGDSEAFDDFYERFSRPLYALGLRWLQDAREAEELVTDTLIRAWQQADRFDPARGQVASWLFGIARHVAADRWRASRRHAADALDRVPEPSMAMDTESLGDAFDVALALAQLSPIHRQVLVLAYGRDQTEAQIAAGLDIPLGTVKSRRFNALRSMANLMTTAGEPAGAAEVKALP